MIREFEDGSGRLWDVVAGRESWGTIVAIFVPADGSDTPRQAPLKAEGYEEGYAEIEALDERDLRLLLERARPMTLD
jgi:hypothetical protein